MQGTLKKVPERRCVGCGKSFCKNDLIRVVKTPDGNVELDFHGKKSGRGAYICKNIECLKTARKAKRLERNLNIAISDEIYNSLEAEITNNG